MSGKYVFVDGTAAADGVIVVTTVADARLLSIKTLGVELVSVLGYYAAGDGGGGPYYYDAGDTSSSDNGGTILVCADGGRIKLQVIDSLISVKQFGARLNGVADDLAAITNAIAALPNGGVISIGLGTLRTTGKIILPNEVKMIGKGWSEINGTGGAARGASCILRAFTGSEPTVALDGDDCGIDLIDVDNDLQGTGDCVRAWGSRPDFGRCSYRNSGGDGLRLGRTNAGASSTNVNAWTATKVIVAGNTLAGMRLDDTNTTTTLSYPLGVANVNAGYCSVVDARNNGTDGLQIGNANDNVFSNVVSQFNGGCGIRFKTDGTNSGPRGNHILGNDCEQNTGNDIQIDAATLPVSGPGLYNVVLGNRSVAISPRIVDNSTGSLVIQWASGLGFRAYHSGSDINALSTSGPAGFNAYVGANNSTARIYGVASGTVDSILRGSVHKNGAGQTDAWEANENAVFQPLNEQVTVPYSASMTIDAKTGHLFDISANNGAAFTINAPTNPYSGQAITITIRNTSGGAIGAITWNAVFKINATAIAPANGNSRSIRFKYNGSNWVELVRGALDVPN